MLKIHKRSAVHRISKRKLSNNKRYSATTTTTTNSNRQKKKQKVIQHHQHQIQPNTALTPATIVDLTHEGHGVAKVDGFPVFLPGALPDEVVEFEIVQNRKTYAHGRVINTLKNSQYRVDPQCKFFEECGGCQLLHMSYEGQLKFKEKMVTNVMTRIGKLNNDVEFKPIIGMGPSSTWQTIGPQRYRNKSSLPIRQNNLCKNDSGSQLKIGYFAARSHDMVNIDDCLIGSDDIKPIVNEFQQFLRDLGIRAYNEEHHTGSLRHIILRNSTHGELMITIVTKTPFLPEKDQIISKLLQLFGESQKLTIYHNINPERTNTIIDYGKGRMHLLHGNNDVIYDTLNGVKFAIGPNSFFQVNHQQTEVLYNEILKSSKLRPQCQDVIIDAYCGIGTIGLSLARFSKEIYGVEVIPEAIDDALKNAKLNNIQNAYFSVGTAESVIAKWYNTPGFRADVLILDPPRKGADPSLLNTILQHQPPRVVYVSCNASTLARDLNHLVQDGVYRVTTIQPVDLFPHTYHCEVIAVLEIVNKQHVVI